MPSPLQLQVVFKKQADPAFLRYYAHRFVDPMQGYIHWTAGYQDEDFDDYHRVVLETQDKKGARLSSHCSSLREFKPAHTYARNHAGFGIAVAGMYKATTQNFGSAVPTPDQIRCLRNHLVDCCGNCNIPVGQLLSHQEAADNTDYEDPHDPAAPHDPYGPLYGNCERWDWWCLIDPGPLDIYPVLGKEQWMGYLKNPEPDRLCFMDWLRGTVFLALQEATRKQWDPAFGRHG